MRPIVPRIDLTRTHLMVVHSHKSRAFLAMYLAFGLPFCCCQVSADSVCCSPDASADATVSRTVDDHVHPGNHQDHGRQHQDQSPGNDQPPDPTAPCDHDDSCECGCDKVDSLFIDQSITIGFPLFSSATVSWIPTVTTGLRPSARRLAICGTGPPTSLVRMHCALIL